MKYTDDGELRTKRPDLLGKEDLPSESACQHSNPDLSICLHRCRDSCGENCPPLYTICQGVSEEAHVVLHCGHSFQADALDVFFRLSGVHRMENKRICAASRSHGALPGPILSLQAPLV